MTGLLKRIEVAVTVPVSATFTYDIPASLADLIRVGSRVVVPFGKRRVTGYVLGPTEEGGPYKVKKVLDVLDDHPLFPEEMIPFFRWIAGYYIHPIGEVIRSALPGGINVREDVRLSLTPEGRRAAAETSVTPLERKLMAFLDGGTRSLKESRRHLDAAIPNALLTAMVRRGWIERDRVLRGGKTGLREERFVALGDASLSRDALSPARREILDFLTSEGAVPVAQLKTVAASAPSMVRDLERSGHVRILLKPVHRDLFGDPVTQDVPRDLTAEQSIVVSAVTDIFAEGYAAYLLAGVTGSGKTEVYLHLARAAMARGLGILVLVPEIALISQMARRFRARFGERVALLHSGLTAGERLDQWHRIMREETPVVIGARSAVFAPLRRPGLIIVDEEHDTSYKQGSDLRYNARDLAVVRARMSRCTVLLGSATPSVHSYHNVREGKFRELRLTRRVASRPLPDITVVDLRKKESARGPRRFITETLHQAMSETLARGEQVLLFLNRRGFASFPICGHCGAPVRCDHCEVNLTLHRLAGVYKCHYCGYQRHASAECPQCGAAAIKQLGLGTEKVEAAVKALFPGAAVVRMDRDTTTRKGSILKILKALKSGTIDVLAGTQMVAKGHDFPNITLVGIICADLTLNFPDFRAGERTFQLLAQVAGRAGRGDVPGRVILQTYSPEHFSIQSAREQDFRAFYEKEIVFRQALDYPPFTRMIQLLIVGRDAAKTGDIARRMGDAAGALRSGGYGYGDAVQVLGPIESSIHRVADRFRWQMIFKSRRVKPLHRMVRHLMAEWPELFNAAGVRVTVDVDPFFMG